VQGEAVGEHTALVRAYVGVTDGRWYRFLADRPELTEVNFWRPGGAREFRTLSAGELFFFKTHRRGRTREIGSDFPYDRVVGGGFFSGFVPLRLSEAWELFGLGNGVASLEQMRLLVGRYRGSLTVNEDPMVGCVLIRDTVFFPVEAAASPPRDFSPSIVQGKGYDLETEPTTTVAYFQDLVGRLLGTSMAVDLAGPWQRTGPVYGDPRLAPQRLGQQAFQAVVLRAYQRRCAVTGDRIRPVLQAAHIRPLPAGGEHRLDNGLLLRSDVHTLYDRGYLGVDPQYRLLVSPRLRDEFGNGEQFYAHAGERIALPQRQGDHPNREFLEWHLDEVFRAS
jgi:putative restriction endonuclease